MSDVAIQLSEFALLSYLLQEIAEDRRAVSSGERIIYVTDIDVLSVYADPYQEASERYMHLLEPKTRGMESASLFYATARITTEDIYLGPLQNSVLLLPTYRRQLLAMVRHYARAGNAAILQNVARHTTEITSAAAAEIRAALKSGSEADAIARFRQSAPYFLISTLFSDAPLDRLERVVPKLLEINQEYAKEAPTPERDDTWHSLFEAIRGHKRHHGKAGDLLLNIEEDVDALLQIVRLNLRKEETGIRFLFVTGDMGIHRTFDEIYLAGSLSKFKWPEFNFVRRPVQLTRFMQQDCLKYSGEDNNHDAVAQAFRVLLPLQTSVDLFKAIHHQEFPWSLHAFASDSLWARVMRFRINQVAQDIAASRQDALALQAEALVSKVDPSNRTGFGLVEFLETHDVRQLLETALHQHLARIQALLEMSPLDEFAATNYLIPLLMSVNVDPPNRVHSNRRLWRRLPTFPKFPDDFRQELLAILEPSAEPSPSPGGRSISNIEAGWLFLLNAYLYALLGNWDEAARQCSLAIGSAQRRHTDRPLLAESHYFRAVAMRHIINPGPVQLLNGLGDLDAASEILDDPRYMVELAAYGLSIPYHEKFYGKYDSALSAAPSAARVYELLLETENRVDREHLYEDDSDVSLRFRTQLYANLCNVYLHSRYLDTDYFRLDPGPTLSELRRHWENLNDCIRRRGGDKRVSYLVRFISLAAKAALVKEEQGHLHNSYLAAIIQKLEGLISRRPSSRESDVLGYDRHKIAAFVEILKTWQGGSDSPPSVDSHP